jgi:predicted transcriptional regulator
MQGEVMTVTLSTRVSESIRDQVDELAQALDRDRAWIVAKALETYIAEQSDFIAAVQRGRADARAGRVTEHDDFMAELDAIIEHQ